ncbi:hypothetical protein [Sphingobium sp. LF-16]|uniref:hypothetical protein n=1 Tax=Sphingobium sp. LF-16 TaxID=2185111 RepID=UPI0013DDFE76|nr:hypothetical protein [Sphingobium sp. LF-16]
MPSPADRPRALREPDNSKPSWTFNSRSTLGRGSISSSKKASVAFVKSPKPPAFAVTMRGKNAIARCVLDIHELSLKFVCVAAADSGSTGKRMLVIDN